jgi:benzoyl-CoA reductase/2-hydroxyglutaryl-CoA dehydratase subunit BcrC/BadD/HgdB
MNVIKNTTSFYRKNVFDFIFCNFDTYMEHQKPEIVKLKSAEVLRKVMDDYFIRLKTSSENRSKKIAWCTSVGPAELLYSMGFDVFFPENHAAMIGASKSADKYIPSAVALGYSPDICSYLTSDIGAFTQGETPLKKMGLSSVPRPDVLIYNTNQCHEVADWFSFYAKHFNVPLLGVSTPLCVHQLAPEIVKSVAEQFKNLVPELEKVSTQKFDLEKFSESVQLSLESCILWGKVLSMAKHKPSPINFFDSIIHMAPIVVMRGTQYTIDYYKTLLHELEDRIEKKISAVPNEKIRLYWDGMPIWYKLSNMAKLFSRLDTCIVASTYSNSWIFDDFNPKDPFESTALAYCKLFIVRSDDSKQEVLEKMMTEYSVDGIIYHDSKTCARNSNNRFGLQNRLFEKNKIPFLEINGDLNDSRCYSEEQSTIAIETFVKQLSDRKYHTV